jgi:hypothetical protein
LKKRERHLLVSKAHANQKMECSHCASLARFTTGWICLTARWKNLKRGNRRYFVGLTKWIATRQPTFYGKRQILASVGKLGERHLSACAVLSKRKLQWLTPRRSYSPRKQDREH